MSSSHKLDSQFQEKNIMLSLNFLYFQHEEQKHAGDKHLLNNFLQPPRKIRVLESWKPVLFMTGFPAHNFLPGNHSYPATTLLLTMEAKPCKITRFLHNDITPSELSEHLVRCQICKYHNRNSTQLPILNNHRPQISIFFPFHKVNPTGLVRCSSPGQGIHASLIFLEEKLEGP